MKRILTFLLFGLFLISCEEQKNMQSDELKEEMADRELKRLSEGEIMAKAKELGGEIAKISQSTLGEQLKKAISEEGVPGALKYCNVNAYPLLDSLQKTYGASIKRASLRARNVLDEPNSIERQILEAYQYNIEQGIDLDENVQRLGDTAILYSKPIILNNGICLNCHGDPQNEIGASNSELIQELYPNDNAQGHKMGDLRGMWSITLSKKEIIRSL